MNILPANAQSLAAAIDVIRKGGIVAHATETCYGLACDITNPVAVERLFAMKKRQWDQPVSALFVSIEQAKQYAEWPDAAEKLARKHLPGPLTIVLPLRKETPCKLLTTPQSSEELRMKNQELRSIGIRVSSHPTAQKLAQKFGKPLSTTSANVHGQPPAYNIEEIVRQFEGLAFQPNLILDEGKLPKRPPSTVIECHCDNTTRILRK